MPTRSDLAKIHIAKKELGLSDEVYRDIMRERYGKESAAKLTPAQAGSLIGHFRSLGWQPKYQQKLPGVYSRPNDAQDRKIIAMWLELHKAGVIKNKTDRALQAFVKRMTKKDNLRWCTTADKNRLIEALKDWGARNNVDLS